MTTKQKQEERKNSISSVVAGVTGAAIGFGIAVAGAAVVLNDKDNRKKIKKMLTDTKNQAMSYMRDVQKKTDKKEREIAEKLANSEDEEAKIIN